jgi:putative PEP-CTERM system TPR-repeat lipoprotein
MKNWTKTISVVLLISYLGACGGDSAEKMLLSAKDYLARDDISAAVIQLKNALQKKPDFAEARFLLGKSLLEQGNAAAADVELRKAANLRYPEDLLVPLQAKGMLMLGQSKKVIEDFGRTQLSSPESQAELQAAIGNAYLAQNDVKTASAAFETALSLFPDFGPALFGQAKIKALANDMEGAMTFIDSVLKNDPGYYEANQLKGDLLAFMGKTGEALAIYQKVLEIKPDYLPAYVSMITRQMETGLLDEAARQFEEMRRVAPTSPQTAYVRAELLYRQKKFSEAREAVQQFLRMLPDSVPGQQLAGGIEFELRSYAAAERYLQSVLPKVPRTSAARRLLIATYLRSAKPGKALEVLQPILAEIDDNSNLLALAGEVFMQNGNTEKASEYFTRASALDPGNKGKQTAIALTRLARGQTEAAYEELERIASTDSGIRADLALIASQIQGRRFDLAMKSIDALERKRADDPMIAPLIDNLRGTARLGMRDVAGARANFEAALQKNPDYFPAISNLAKLDLAARAPEAAKQRFRDVLARNPGSSFALLALAELEGRSGGKKEEVLSLIKRSVAANPTDASSHLMLVSFYLGTRDVKKAVAAAQEALAVLPDNPAILDVEGRAQQAAGNFNQALSAYARLSELNPGSTQPYLRMAEIHVASKNKDAAMQTLRKALSVKPDSIEAQRATIMLDLDAGRFEEAVATARNIQRQYPESPAGFLLEGDAHLVGKAWKEAAEVYRKGIKQTGASDLAIALHAALMAQDNASEANRLATSWLKDHAKDQRFRLYLAESATARKDYSMAIRHFQTLLLSQPENPALLNNMAWVMAQNKDPKALETAEKAYSLDPEKANIVDTLGALLVERGEFDRGLELLRKARSLAPNNPMILFNLASALVKAGNNTEAKPLLVELSTLGPRFSKNREVSELLQGMR